MTDVEKIVVEQDREIMQLKSEVKRLRFLVAEGKNTINVLKNIVREFVK